MLVVIEGLDGAGKSTQVKKLRSYLESKCGEVEYIHFPRYDAPVYGDLISSFLRGDFGSINDVHPKLVALLYAEDRRAAAPSLRAALNAEKCVLLDRYVYSNIAYQCAKVSDPQQRESLRKWIENTEYGEFDLPRPDLNIFLDVPISFVEKKLSDSRKGHDRDYLEGARDIHEADIRFQEQVREVYLRQTSLDSKFIRVDCSAVDGSMLPPQSLFSKIKSVTDSHIFF